MAQATVLIVDDAADQREMLAELLRQDGFLPIEACNSEDALRIATASPPALAVVDLRLPGSMNGLELTRRLKQGAATRHVPVVMLTGMARAQDRGVAASAGADAFLLKPCSPKELISEIRRLLSARQDAPRG